MTLRTISYGGGVQSTALLVLAAEGRIDYRTFLFANVGEDSEDPRTLAYVRDIATPYADAHGISIIELHRHKRDGQIETLWGRLMREESRSLPIPIRMDNGAPGQRSCTSDFKIRVVGKWLKAHGAHGGRACNQHVVPAPCSAHQKPKAKRPCRYHPAPDCADCLPANLATVGIGISLDEIQRANTRKVEPHERVVYPLVGIGEETGLHLRRDDCMRIIRDAGIPVPPKSSCFFCPFHREAAWSDLARERPDLFAKAVHLEDTLNARRDKLGKDHVYLTRFAMPLSDVINDGQPLLPLLDDASDCDSGWSMT